MSLLRHVNADWILYLAHPKQLSWHAVVFLSFDKTRTMCRSQYCTLWYAPTTPEKEKELNLLQFTEKGGLLLLLLFLSAIPFILSILLQTWHLFGISLASSLTTPRNIMSEELLPFLLWMTQYVVSSDCILFLIGIAIERGVIERAPPQKKIVYVHTMKRPPIRVNLSLMLSHQLQYSESFTAFHMITVQTIICLYFTLDYAPPYTCKFYTQLCTLLFKYFFLYFNHFTVQYCYKFCTAATVRPFCVRNRQHERASCPPYRGAPF